MDSSEFCFFIRSQVLRIYDFVICLSISPSLNVLFDKGGHIFANLYLKNVEMNLHSFQRSTIRLTEYLNQLIVLSV